MEKVFESITQVIGATPMVRLSRLARENGVSGEMFAKLEYLNPGLSKKDRPALQIIEEAEAAGALRPGQPVVELTSGNMGTGLAIVCKAKGYPFIACMSAGNSMERMRMMRALGAEVVLVPQGEGRVKGQVSGDDLALVELEAQRITEERNAFRADQFRHTGAVHAHWRTADEMWAQADGRIDVFVDFAGSGSAFAGCAERLKAHDPNIRCYLVEPENAAIYAGMPIKNGGAHKIQGGGYNMELPLIRRELIDGYIQVTDEEATRVARALAAAEGMFVGFSSGANAAAAIALLNGKEKGRRVVFTLNDSGLKYLSTSLFEDV